MFVNVDCHNDAKLPLGGGYERLAAFMDPIEVSDRLDEGLPTWPCDKYSIATVTGVRLDAMGPQIFTDLTRTDEHNLYAALAPVAIHSKSSKSCVVTTALESAEDASKR